MFTLFVEGGWFYMTVLTVSLAAIFFAAWKAPRWVKEIGSFALVFGFFSLLLGLRQMFTSLQHVASMQSEKVETLFDIISPNVLFGGLKVVLIPVLYGVIIYLISLVVRVIQKPRL